MHTSIKALTIHVAKTNACGLCKRRGEINNFSKGKKGVNFAGRIEEKEKETKN